VREEHAPGRTPQHKTAHSLRVRVLCPMQQPGARATLSLNYTLKHPLSHNHSYSLTLSHAVLLPHSLTRVLCRRKPAHLWPTAACRPDSQTPASPPNLQAAQKRRPMPLLSLLLLLLLLIVAPPATESTPGGYLWRCPLTKRRHRTRLQCPPHRPWAARGRKGRAAGGGGRLRG